MKYVDYREKLGTGFNNKEKFEMLKNKIYVFFETSNQTLKIYKNDIITYSISTGVRFRFNDLNYLLEDFLISNKFETLIAKYVTFCNVYENKLGIDEEFNTYVDDQQTVLLNFLRSSLDDLNIQYEIIKDKDGYFIFPKGAKELDDKLISEPLEWLKEYPDTRKTFIHTLKQYANKENPRDVADNLRKTLEGFLQEFFNNSKNLDKNIGVVGDYLDEKGAVSELKAIFTTLVSNFNQANNAIAKHHDKINDNYLEFLLYQTGVFIRTLITLKQENK